MHRPSFPDKQENNSFWSVSTADQIVLDGEYAPAPAWVIEACAAHQAEGYHADCIHCNHGSNAAPRVIISGGEVLEIDAPQPGAFDPNEVYPF